MRRNLPRICTVAALALITPLIAISKGEIKNLVIAGYQGSVPVKQIEGKDYVEIQALARLANGSVSFDGEQITLALPPPVTEAAITEGENSNGFSKEFLHAWIEELAAIREWHGALEAAVRSQTPLWQVWLGSYQSRAKTNLQFVQVAAVTNADRSAAQLVANEYQKMKQLNDEYAAQAASVSYIEPDSLADDPLNRTVTVCGQALESMAASGQFLDNGSCL